MKRRAQAAGPKGPSPLFAKIAEGLRELFLPSYIFDIDELLTNLAKDKKPAPAAR
jgi:hypothetical protein